MQCIFKFFLLLSAAAADDTHKEAAFQNVINTASYLSRKAAISLGVAMPSRTLALAAGYKHREKALELKPRDRMGIGSATKTMTAAATLKMVDAGTFGLDEFALPLMDPLVRSITRKSLLEYLGPEIRNVTVRQMLDMTSGIGDLDSKASRLNYYEHPERELDLHHMMGETMRLAQEERVNLGQLKDPSHTFTCLPGKCGEYSSTNYFLLGLILAQASGVEHWSLYDQSSFLPPKVRQNMPSTVFPIKGRLGSFTDVRAYMPPSSLEQLVSKEVIDTFNLPANVGFTVANALSTGADVATFWRALLGQDPQIISAKQRTEMMKLRWLETGLGNKVSVGQFYGMAVRDVSGQLVLNNLIFMKNPEIFFAGLLYGHDGMSAAGYSSFNGYAPRHDFSLSFIMNDYRAAVMFNFVARKVYDLAAGLSPPVKNPLQAVYHNKAAFMAQPHIANLKHALNSNPLEEFDGRRVVT